MASREEQEGAQAFVDHMLSITQRLMLVIEDEVKSAASGVIVSLCDRYYLLSAGHALVRPGRWFVETNVQFWPPKMLALNVPDPVVFDIPTEDFGWAELDIPAIEAQFRADHTIGETTLAIPYYRGSLDTSLDSGMAYGFASYKAVEYHADVRKLWREFRYEINMQYDGLDARNGLYRFKLNRPHQGHEYYYGCSGAPIADVYGRIVSLVIEGPEDPKDGIIWGTPLENYLGSIGKH